MRDNGSRQTGQFPIWKQIALHLGPTVRLDLFEKLSVGLHSMMIDRFTAIASFLRAKDLQLEGT